MKALGKTIAVVDDHEDIAEVCVRRLTRLGYDVLAFTDPRLFVDRVIEHGLRVDALLLDVAMPHLSGLDVLRLLEERGTKPGTVILMTAIEDQALHVDGFLAGATAVITKPLDWTRIAKLLETALGIS